MPPAMPPATPLGKPPADGPHLTILGTKGGPAIRPGSAMPTSMLLCLGERPIVVDCGLGVTRALAAQGMELRDLSLIFVTHLHSDHYLELGPLLHTAWTAGLKSPVDVWGPPGLARYLQGFLAAMEDDIALRIADEGRPDPRQLVRLHVIAPEGGRGVILACGGLVVEAMRNRHPPLADSFALSFRSGGIRVVLSGDTAPMPEMADFARGADLLVHEAMLGEALADLVARVGNGDDRLMRHLLRSHSPAAEVAGIAARAGVRALALNHLIPSDDPAFTEDDWRRAVRPVWPGPLHIGRDGLRIPLETGPAPA